MLFHRATVTFQYFAVKTDFNLLKTKELASYIFLNVTHSILLVVFPHIHRLQRLKAAKDGEQAMSSPLNLPRSSFAAAVAAKNILKRSNPKNVLR